MQVATLVVGEFQENCYLLLDGDGRAAFIDPGGEPRRLERALEDSGAVLEAIWLTHAHLDHIGAIAGLRRKWPVPVHLHPADRPLYAAAERQAQMYGLQFEEPPPPDVDLADGDVLRLGALVFSVLHSPGHSPGHVVIHGQGVAFVGDCLFAGSVGRTDLPGSDGAQLGESLVKIASLPPQTVVYPGHGPPTTIETERHTNPFLTGAARIPV